ncbi:MAG: LacI family transcriptional regulator [Spirochaetaceae bacterium]|nr:MAG: LacI family transcriptional regulator [Spirochaetaceae bacterium]
MPSRTRKPRPTQKQIAHDLGISVMTVQRAIHGTGYVSAELRTQITEYMKRVDYRPDRAARSLVKGSHRTVALFSTDEPRSFWTDVARGIDLVAHEIVHFGFAVDYHRVPHGNTTAYLRVLDRSIRAGLDAAAVVNNSEFDMDRVFRKLDGSGIPYITLNIDAPETGRLCFVGPDYVREGRIVAHHLRQIMGTRGHVIVVTGPEQVPRPGLSGAQIEVDRIRGVRDYCAEVRGYSDHELVWTPNSRVDQVAERIATAAKAIGRRPVGIYIPHVEPNDADVLFQSLPDVGPVVLSYFSSHTTRYLDSGRVSAVVYQDPVLQGYLATRVLEHIVESGGPPPSREYIIQQSLINKENAAVVDNLFLVQNLRSRT